MVASGRPAGGEGRLAVVGMSIRARCGVRDHATILARALADEGLESEVRWLQRRDLSLAGSRREVGRWTRELSAELERERPRAVLLHYSVFALSHKGVPIFLPQTLRAVRAAGAPVLVVLHELAYSWRHGGPRGRVWALTQRAGLIALMRACAGALVTMEERAAWLRSCWWLPQRPLALAPVFSNLPRANPTTPSPGAVGLFGFTYEGAAIGEIVGALASARGRRAPARLRLLGATSPAARASWEREAGRRGVGEAVSFTGALPAQELADALAGCEVLLFADSVGPTSRKGTLAASLDAGRPLIAFDGRQTWERLARAGAVRLVQPTASSLADALVELLGDEDARALLGARARSFYEREMDVSRTSAAVRELLQEVAGERSRYFS